MKRVKNSFWITNISKRDVLLSDLNLRIPAMSSMDLLRKTTYLTEEQVLKSFKSGSLFNKRDKIVKRLLAPGEIKNGTLEIDLNATTPSNQRSLVEVKTIKHEELEEEPLDVSKEDALKQEFDEIASMIDDIEDEPTKKAK